MEWSCFTTGGQLLIIISQHLLFLVLGRVVFLEKNLDLCSKVLCNIKCSSTSYNKRRSALVLATSIIKQQNPYWSGFSPRPT
jgi:hypothetical protein